MVLAEKNNEDARNGRRSTGPSPNGHLSDDGSATDDSDRDDNGMRVGEDYQAAIPELVNNSESFADYSPERALLVWLPSGEIPETKLDEFVTIAKEKFGYNAEQALGMLFWHKHDLEKAIADLPNFTPFPDEWTVEDKVLFEQAFQFHGKSFHRIRQMLPDKTIASLVKYYYSWKKTRSRTSLMDRQARKLATQREEGSEIGSEVGSNSDSEFEGEKGETKEDNGVTTKVNCSNCNLSCSHTHSTPKGNLCNICYQYWRRTGMMRPTTGLIKNVDSKHDHKHHPLKSKRKPPRGMYLSYDDLLTVATGPPGQGDAILKAMDSEIVSLKRQVQNSKQIISALKHKTSSGIDEFRPSEGHSRLSARWSNEELLLAVQGVRKYGKDFKAISEVIGNKTEAHVRSFFVNYRRRYNLDAILEEFESENGPIPEEEKEEKMEVDSNSSKSNSNCSTPTPPVLVTSAATTTAPPPPLLKPVQAASVNSKPPPLHQTARVPITRTMPQQPPPLIRPNAVPIMTPKSQPPQLTTRNS